MYGHCPSFSVLVNAEVDSMGGVVDGGVGVDNKTSPRHVAIERAQAELRQEYYVREERKKELEFLEKGGNPLDFKFGPTTSISIQSTSFTDQLLDYDAKGSSALATSPHGDSVDSSGRPGPTLGNEPNTADNLLLIDGQNGKHDGTRNEMHSGKRKNIASSEHSSKQDGSNVKESEESGVFRLGAKSQAYARRNRSRPNRDSAYAGSAHSAPSTHGNSASPFPSPCLNSRDKRGPSLETQVEDHAVSSFSNSKLASPCHNNIFRTLGIDGQVEMDLDVVEAKETGGLILKADVREGEAEVTTSNHQQQNDCNVQTAKADDQQCRYGAMSIPSKLTVKEAVSVGVAGEPFETDESFNNATKAGSICSSSEFVTDLQKENHTNKHLDGQAVSGGLASNVLQIDPSNANADADSHRAKELKPECDANIVQDRNVREKSDLDAVNVPLAGDVEPRSADHELVNSLIQVKNEELFDRKAYLQSKERHELAFKEDGKPEHSLCDISKSNPKGLCPPSCLQVNICESSNPGLQIIPGKNLKLSKKAREDAILKEARIIKAKLKRVNELSLCSFPSEKHHKSHWDYVLEEMAWLANDFIQERLWKITAASQISHWIASSGRSKFEKENHYQNHRNAARSMAKAVMSFWKLAEMFHTGGKPSVDMDKECNSSLFVSWKCKGQSAAKKQDGENLEEESSTQATQIPILGYAVDFLKCNSPCDRPVLAEAPATPERICDAGVWAMPWEDQSSEESLFYPVPAGAMRIYRDSIESRWLQHEKTSTTVRREVYDSLAEDEAETATHYLPVAFEGNKSKFSHKKKKNLEEKTYGVRAYEVRSDLSYGPYQENKLGTHPSLLTGKRPSNTFNVCSIPTKKVRTASRQRVVSPFSAGNAGGIQATSKTDVSSGDTSSFLDDQSSFQCGSQARKSTEVESTADFEKKMLFDDTDISNISKKKMKLKHTGYKNLNPADGVIASKGSLYEHGWQFDPVTQHDQKDHLKKQLESHLFDSIGNHALHGQHASKKPKLLKQLAEASPETITPVIGSIPSPAASQMSSMSNANKLIKMIASRDRSRRSKALKITAGQLGSAGSWSQFEDQALVVLVHDMGPNWELVSDAINSALQFKCIFRKPNECKERHKVLMERSAGDGADSAEDSCSSQSYQSTLHGIPKGGARQLFQRLQGPMEEDILKAHFEKIIIIGQQLHFHRNQTESRGKKQMIPVHHSHLHALSQACPNNSTGSPLTPIDLCESTPSPEALGPAYQCSHPNGSPTSTHTDTLSIVMPTSGVNSMLHGSPSLGMNNGFSSPSAPPTAPTRDSPRYGVPRPPPFPADEQQRMQQQYSQILSGRNVQQPSMSVARMLSGGNGMGMMCGMNGGMPMARPGFQGIGPPGVLNVVASGSALQTGGVGMSSPVNIHCSAVAGQGNSLLRQHDHLQMQWLPQNPEDHKQMIMQELHQQVTQGNCQSGTPVNGMSAPFPGQGAPASPIQTFSPQPHQHPHQMSQQPHLFGNPHHPPIQGTNHMSPQHQAYAMHVAKDRQQLQHRLLHQQQHFSGSNATTPSQNGSQIPQQSQTSPGTSMPSPQAQHKQQNISRNSLSSGGMPNQMMKQRLQQQQPRHQQQRQQPQQQGNFSKGLAGGNTLMHQNVPVDASQVNPPSTMTTNQLNERHLLQQGQGLFAGAPGSGSALPLSSSQPKIYSRPPTHSSKSVQPMASHSDSCNHPLLASQQSSLSPLASASQQQQRQTNQSQQAMQRMMLQQNHHMNSDAQLQSAVDQVQVNKMIVTTPSSQCTNSGSTITVATSAPLSASHWKPEPSYDATMPVPTVQLATLAQQNLVGTEANIVPSGQGLPKRPFSGTLPMHVHGIGGQWQQPKQPQQQPLHDQRKQHQPPQRQQQHQPPQNQQQHQPPHNQQQHRQSGQSALYVAPSNSGPG